MKVIITMDSGKVYSSELDNSIQAFKERLKKVKSLDELDLLPVDKIGSKQISIRHISSVEAVEESKEVEVDDTDSVVYY
ncbi:hypothetical protein [Priestia megaterium]|uniref:hypothetical protein n=1 Tax=Priestia megaterium TaxID=1404 RepID=UPI002799DD61|nr:hypothetical protein [Priestia megaterium]WDC90585.1 hypothetical protein PSR56_11270 [Priestia megaterium]